MKIYKSDIEVIVSVVKKGIVKRGSKRKETKQKKEERLFFKSIPVVGDDVNQIELDSHEYNREACKRRLPERLKGVSLSQIKIKVSNLTEIGKTEW